MHSVETMPGRELDSFILACPQRATMRITDLDNGQEAACGALRPQSIPATTWVRFESRAALGAVEGFLEACRVLSFISRVG